LRFGGALFRHRFRRFGRRDTINNFEAPVDERVDARPGAARISEHDLARIILGAEPVRICLLLGGPAAISRSASGEVPTGEFMAVERTFSILKPDATARNLTGAINAIIEKAGLRIIAQRRIRMSRSDAEKFYEVHKERPFYGELVEFMTSGPVVVQVLEGENAVAKYREVMGATDPAKAADGTIRKVHAKSVGENSVHGSDSPENAKKEIAQFFKDSDIVG
jgi:nucleoside-diphosphate kinase